MRIMLGALVLATASASSSGSLILYTPSQPLRWESWRQFDPSRPSGFVEFGAQHYTSVASTTPPVTEQRMTSILLMSLKVERIDNVVALYTGQRHTYPSGDFWFWTLRHYPIGSSVDPTEHGGGSATLAWHQTPSNIWRTYIVRDASAPSGERFVNLPNRITAGFTSFSFVTGYSHPCWADLEWRWTGVTGDWWVSRWGYETEPGVPARIPPTSGCPSDFNGDRDTNAADLSILLAQFGTSVTPGTGADTNGNGVVDTGDLSALLAWFGCNEVAV